jgi:hypothetical protein
MHARRSVASKCGQLVSHDAGLEAVGAYRHPGVSENTYLYDVTHPGRTA